MKKLVFLMFAMTLSVVTFAQSREQVEKKLNSAIQNSENPKKSAKYSTWFGLGEAYANAYRNPAKDIWPGMPAQQVKMILNKERVQQTEQREVQGVPFIVDVYEDKELYYNQGGVLEIIVVTKPVVEGDMLQSAFDAFLKAYELDTKGSKIEELAEAVRLLKDDAMNDAVNSYMLGDYAAASVKFEKFRKMQNFPLGIILHNF